MIYRGAFSSNDLLKYQPTGDGPNSITLGELMKLNKDVVGWITIFDTHISYPVVQGKDNQEYLNKDVFGKFSFSGSIFLDYRNACDFTDSYSIIYGHHMKNGTMFAALADYENKDFYEKHKVIQFDTLTENGKYEIAAVFKTTVYDTKGFAFYEFVNADKNEKFDEYVRKCKRLSLYETNVIPEYGDDLLTLVTCEYSARNGRMVVVAKKIE